MALRARAYPGNAPGAFFVDDTCIDCDTCRQLAPGAFADAGGHSEVHVQPSDAAGRRAAARAAVCCPTGSIGCDDRALVRSAVADFPLALAALERADPGADAAADAQVFYCGFNAESSYGGNSYLLLRPDGNWLIDSPRYLPQLATAIAAHGGISRIFLTHRDDVADAARWAARFGARRIIHRRDASAAPDAELVLDGDEPIDLAPGLVALPTPGHTAGHMVLIAGEEHCFSGDHLWWSRRQGRLMVSRSVCWHSWREQTASMARLAERRFAWVLPGHGQRVRMTHERMRSGLRALASAMASQSDGDDG